MSDAAGRRELHSLTELLAVLSHAAERPQVSVENVLSEVGERSFTPVILAISIILISPVSAIPGMPTMSAIAIVLIAAQALAGRRHLWLPGFLMRRSIRSERFLAALGWLKRTCAFVDRHSHERLWLLTRGPARPLAFLLCILIAATWPLLEILPMVTSVGATAVALLSFGLLTHDGLYTLLGCALTAAMAALAVWLMQV